MGPATLPAAIIGLAISLPLLASAGPAPRSPQSGVAPHAAGAATAARPGAHSAHGGVERACAGRIALAGGLRDRRVLSFVLSFAENAATATETGTHA